MCNSLLPFSAAFRTVLIVGKSPCGRASVLPLFHAGLTVGVPKGRCAPKAPARSSIRTADWLSGGQTRGGCECAGADEPPSGDPFLHVRTPIANRRLRRVAEFNERRAFALAAFDFECVVLVAEQSRSLGTGQIFVLIGHVQVSCQNYRRVTQSRDGVSSCGAEPEPVGYIALCCSR